MICECGHLISEHDPSGECFHILIYPYVLIARQCGCESIRPKQEGKNK